MKVGSLARAVVLVCALAAPALAGDTPDSTEAKAYFSDGTAAFSRGDYAAASRAFAAGYEIERWNGFLFAWAQAERKANQCTKAIELYSRFIATDPGTDAAEHALGWIKACGGEYVAPPPEPKEPIEDPPGGRPARPPVTEPIAKPLEVPPGVPPARPPGFSHKLALGLGVAAIASGGLAIWQLRRAGRDFDSADAAIDYQDVALRRARGEDHLRVARIAGGLGLGLAAAAVLRFVLHDPSPTPTTEVVPAGRGLAIRRRF